LQLGSKILGPDAGMPQQLSNWNLCKDPNQRSEI